MAAPRRISLTLMLAVSLGVLVAIAATSVLVIGLWSARENTMELLSERAEVGMSSAVAQIDQHLQPAVEQARYVAEMIAAGETGPEDEAAFKRFLIASLAGVPQVRGLVFIDTEHRLIGAERGEEGPRAYTADYSDDAVVRQAVAATETAEGAVWGAPAWRPRFGLTILNLRYPVRREGRYLGILVAVVSIAELSTYLAELSEILGDNAFILYDRDQVLAHGNLIGEYPGLTQERPLPMLESFGDPVLAGIWRDAESQPLEIALPENTSGHWSDLYGQRYIFVHRELRGYGERPWQVGAYFRNTEVNAVLRRLMWAAAAGLATLVLACIAAVLLARHIARPIVRLAEAASRIGELELAEVSELPGSIYRELDRQANAFNNMLSGLRWFETYVPKTLVRRLVQHGEAGAVASVEREVTVMFTDIAGFTALSEGKQAADVAAFLNEHFAMIAAAVEETGGTVDKFIGDAVMAFWGAPEEQPDHAERACRAALAIAEAHRAANRERTAQGLPTVGLRLGLHSGPVTVGNIGAPGRMNYTIVGDTVNVGQRLEALCKELNTEGSDFAAALSAATAAQLGPDFAPQPVGRHQVPGRQEPIEVFTLG